MFIKGVLNSFHKKIFSWFVPSELPFNTIKCNNILFSSTWNLTDKETKSIQVAARTDNSHCKPSKESSPDNALVNDNSLDLRHCESNEEFYVNYSMVSTQANTAPIYLAHNSSSTVGSSPSSSISGLSSLEISTSSPIHSDTTSSNEGFFKRLLWLLDNYEEIKDFSWEGWGSLPKNSYVPSQDLWKATL